MTKEKGAKPNQRNFGIQN